MTVSVKQTAKSQQSAAKSHKPSRLRQRLILGTSFATSVFVGGYRGYVRRAYAACTGSGGTYTCSGVLTTTQTLTGTPLSITTAPGFSINTSAGSAFALTGTGGFTFTDNNASTITGATVGIYASNTTGSLSITTTGTVTGNSGQGILSKLDFGSSDLTIHAASVSGTVDGIYAFSNGSGALSITSTGNVNASNGLGIYARTFSASSVSVTAVNASGLQGIWVDHEGSGDATITTTGTVTGTSQNGIYAYTGSNTTNLTIHTAGAVTGNQDGIYAKHYGTGALSITSTGIVTGTNGRGIYAYSGSTITDLIIHAADVTGDQGIYVKQNGAGRTSITSSGTVTGTLEQGILVRDTATAGAMTISAVNVYGGAGGPNNQMRAIDAYHLGSGDLTITTTGTVTANSDNAIQAKNYGGALTIQANSVSGQNLAIRAAQYGSGVLSVTTSGTVTAGNDGIYAYGGATAAGITIHTADITSGFDGINVSNRGIGATSITSTGSVTGPVRGIYAYSGPATTDTTITAANINGHNAGISALHYGSGNLSITVTGAVAANAGPGIQAYERSTTATSMGTVSVISSGSVSGTIEGVYLGSPTGRAGSVLNAGSITGTKGILANGGTVTITNSGAITGSGGTAIDLTATTGANTVNQQGGTISGNILLSAAADQVHITGGTINGNVVGQGNAGVDFAIGSGGFTFGAPYTMSGFSTATMISGTAQIAGTINTNSLIVNGGTMIVTGAVNTPAFALNSGGVLSISSNANLGSGIGALNFNGGILQVTGTSITAPPRPYTWGPNGGGFDIVAAGNVFTVGTIAGGGGPLTKLGAGTLVLTGANSYTGGTTIQAGTLQLGDGTTSGSLLGNVADNGALVFNNPTNQTFAGVISGTGSLSQIGSGSTILTGNNTYTGSTTIAAGTLQLGNGGTSGSLAATAVTDNGAVVFDRSDTATFAGGITGTGTLTQAGGGTVILTGTSSLGSVTTSFGTLQVASGGQLTATTVTLLSNSGGSVMTVTGTGSSLTTNALNVGTTGGVGGTATFNVLNGAHASVTGAGSFNIGGFAASGSSVGTVNVDGAGSLLQVAGTIRFNQVSSTSSTVNVSNGGKITSAGTLIGQTFVNVVAANATVSGAGSTWTNTGNLSFSRGFLSILNGGAYVTATGTINSAGGTAVLTVDGAGSSFTSNGAFSTTTSASTAIITLSNGGSFVANGSLTLGTVGTTILSIGGAEGQAATAPGTLSVASFSLGGASRIDFNHTSTGYVFAPVISGAGALNQVAGTTILTGTNSYTGGTTISGGTLQLGNGGTSGSVTGNVADNGILAFNRSDTITFANVISGSGSVIQAGSGITALSGTNTYTGGTVLNAGTLQAATDANLGGAAGALTFNGGLFENTATFASARNVTVNSGGGAFQTDANLTLSGIISGSGALTKTGSGTLILTGANTYTGGTIISAGVVQIGNGGTSGSIAGNVTDNAGLVFNRSDSLAVSSAISGTGSVTQAGSGTTTLSGTNGYTGGTTIAAGTLIGSATAFGSGPILDNAALVVNQPVDAVFSNAINGSGSFTKQGAGGVNYTGTGGLTGPTTVAAGLLSVNGSLSASAVTVQNGATLGGNGAVGGTIIQSGGTIAPGNSIGTLHINGAFVQAAGSTYQVEVDPNTTASDLIQVNGMATLQSGAGLNVTKYVAGNYQVGTVYKVLSATNGLTGTYTLSGQTTAVSAFLGLKDSYDANNAYLTVIQTQPLTSAAATPNQQDVANAVGSLPPSNPIDTAVLNLPDVPSARAAFDQLSGQSQASAQGALLSNGLYMREVAFDRLRDVVCSPSGRQSRSADCDGRRLSIWAQGFGGWGGISGNANATGLNHSAAGFLVGMDVPVSVLDTSSRAGIFGGYSHADFHLVSGGAAGESNDYHLGLYGGTVFHDVALRLGASYSWSGIITDRSVVIGSFSDALHGIYNGGTTQAFGEAGRRLDLNGFSLEPFANLTYINLRTSGFTEAGGPAALTVEAHTIDNVVTTLGVRPSVEVALDGFEGTLRGMAGWRHTAGTVTPTSIVSFAGSNPFSVSGTPIARDAAALEAGLDVTVMDGMTLGLTYGGQFSDRTTDQTARGTIRVSF